MAIDRTGRFRVVVGGISVGSENVTAGTLTGRFVDKTDGATVIVSNRHVFDGKPSITLILQPGPYDGGKAADCIGILKRMAPLETEKKLPWWKRIICALLGWILEEWCIAGKQPARLDAACASWKPTDTARELAGGVLMDDGRIIRPAETVSGDNIAGRKVWKAGRTTGVTLGTVESDSAKVKVWYGDRWVIFEDVVIVKGIARGGDSGSPVFLMEDSSPSEKDKLCGILFAGSAEYYVFCKYKYLETILNVRWQP